MRLVELKYNPNKPDPAAPYDPVGFDRHDISYSDIDADARDKLAAKVAKYINKNCQPWLQQTSRGLFLAYRGFRRDPKHHLAFVKAVRKDRVPRDTGSQRHMEFNHFIRRAGKVANRTNSVFLTSNRTHAGDFGEVFIVFPVGQFNYTWLPGVSDWTEDIIDIEAKYKIEDLKGDDGTLEEALKRGAEIMVSCEKIVAVGPWFYSHYIEEKI